MARMCRQCPEKAFAKGLCEKHYHMEQYVPLGPRKTKQSKNRIKKVKDERWERLSKRWLAKYPNCMACSHEGRTTPAGIVDHILPRRHFPELIYDENNLQSLCQTRPYSCHQRKTGYERRGIALDFIRMKRITFFNRIVKT